MSFCVALVLPQLQNFLIMFCNFLQYFGSKKFSYTGNSWAKESAIHPLPHKFSRQIFWEKNNKAEKIERGGKKEERKRRKEKKKTNLVATTFAAQPVGNVGQHMHFARTKIPCLSCWSTYIMCRRKIH
jgi:hypothetical protein